MEAQAAGNAIGPYQGRYKAFGGQSVAHEGDGELVVVTRMKCLGNSVVPYSWEAVFEPGANVGKMKAQGAGVTIDYDSEKKLPCIVSYKLPME